MNAPAPSPRTAAPRRPAAPAPSPAAVPAPSTNDPDNAKFEAKARELLAPAADRPAVVTAPEVEAIRRTCRSGQGRFDALRKLAITRLALVDEKQGKPPRLTLSDFERIEAVEFFKVTKASFAVAQPPAELGPSPMQRAQAAAPSTPKPAEPRPAPAPAKAAPSMAEPNLAAIMAELKALRGDVAALRQALAEREAAAPSMGGEAFTDFLMDSVKVGVDEKTGEKTYKAQGPSYKKFGVKIWPEVLPELGINADTLKFGENKLPKGIKVRALLVDGKPKKVVGLAP